MASDNAVSFEELGEMQAKLIAPCGMNCRICVGYFGFTMGGRVRKQRCPGCRPRNKNCSFLKKHCARLRKGEIEFCGDCADFPCQPLENLDKTYRDRYNMSMIENLRNIQEQGMEIFLAQQKERYACPECGQITCVHTKRCYSCRP